MIVSTRTGQFPDFSTKVRVASAFFLAGIKTLLGVQEFVTQGKVDARKLSKKDYEQSKKEALKKLSRGESVNDTDFYATMKF